jgi:hypothetical protein
VTQAWPLAESLQRLEQALVSPIQVRTGPDELPMRSEASLQTVIREWENVRRTQTLKNKTEELDFLRLRVSREVAVIVEEYRQTLLKYLQNDFRTPPVFSHGERIGQGRVGKETLKRLDELDTRREALRRTLEPVATAKTEGTVVESP